MMPALVVTLLVPMLAGLAPAGRHLGAGDEVKELLVVKSTRGKAVVRFGTGPLTTISVGDLLGRHRAEVKEIDGGRVVLEEPLVEADGRRSFALIILEDGKRGGTRYLSTPEGKPPVVVRPATIEPEQKDGKASTPRRKPEARRPDERQR